MSLLLFVTQTTIANANTNTGLANPDTYIAHEWIDSVMNKLTLREKIAQLFMVAAYSNRDDEHIEEIEQLVAEEKIGGLCFFQGGPVRQAQLTNYYQQKADVPLLISMDAEWGLGMRLDSAISYPRQMMLGAMDDNRLIYHMGADIARQLKRMGVHINFAPVVDVNSNPENPVINTRAFGENREIVTQKGLAYMLGLQDNGIIACAKHFPGHGDTDTDSHYDLPLLNHNRSRLDSLELYPFRKLIQNGAASVMVAHMEIPELESTKNLASSLSGNVVSSLLLDELGFKGLAITDALNMKGVSDYFNPVDLNYKALKAGNDIILFPSEVKASISKIEKEVKRGRFPVEEIDRRCRKIIEAKYKVGLSNFKPVEIDGLVEDINKDSYKLLVRQITEQAITVLNNKDSLIPIQRLDTLSIAYVEIGDERGADFINQMELYAPITSFVLKAQPSHEDLTNLEEKLDDFNLIIVGHHRVSTSSDRDYGITPQVASFINKINDSKKVIFSLFGTPYALSKFSNTENFNGLVVSYDNSAITQQVTAQLLFGGLEVNGRLPVTASQAYPLGSGLPAGKRIRLKYSIPEEMSIKQRYITKVDSIITDAIYQQATPGVQVLAAKDGVVFYNKCFGNHTYIDADLEVNNSSIYDVASITKIASTLTLAMDLYSKNRLNLNDTLGTYLNLPDTSKLNGLVINDMLLHQSGLTPWIPFYLRTLSSLWPGKPLINGSFSTTFPYQLARNRFMTRHTTPSRKYYRNNFSFEYPHQVAHGLYAKEEIKDSIFTWIMRSPLNEPGEYRYSDLGFMLLHQAIGNIINMPHEEYLSRNFYSKLGMNHTGFFPLNRFEQSRIAPTENDLFFRKRLIWGHVHDQGAAMLGGIAGHAGLFSNANDLAKLSQMFLNRGTYGGDVYFPSETIDLFTSCINCVNGVRRGLGFDKPEPDPEKSSPVCSKATSLSYGHAGFTGTMMWVDPAYDFVYIFISNRIHPDASNRRLIELDVRTRIQETFYEALEDSEEVY
ncbi:MAG: glycoside hydrolase family 3 N-terminal domain-containing protein [Bacteroidales bacterium]